MNIEELLREHDVTGKKAGEHHHARRGWIQYDCPECGRGSHKYHLGLNIHGQYFNCYRCGRVDRVEAVSGLLDISIQKTLSLLKQVSRSVKGPESAIPSRLRGFLKLPIGRHSLEAKTPINARKRGLSRNTGFPLGEKHRDYLISRGFDPDEIIRIWKIEGISVSPPLSWRLFIPIFDVKGKMVSWTTRSISKSAKLRYVSARSSQESVPHKSILYGEHLCSKFKPICVVEGPISAWAIGPGCVATCGVGFTREQAVRLARYTFRYVCFDAEPQAQRRAQELCDFLSVTGPTFNIVLSDKDPAVSMVRNKKEIEELRSKLR